MSDADPRSTSALAIWFRDLLRGPVVVDDRYFDRLGGRVASSAPLCTTCR